MDSANAQSKIRMRRHSYYHLFRIEDGRFSILFWILDSCKLSIKLQMIKTLKNENYLIIETSFFIRYVCTLHTLTHLQLPPSLANKFLVHPSLVDHNNITFQNTTPHFLTDPISFCAHKPTPLRVLTDHVKHGASINGSNTAESRSQSEPKNKAS